MNIIEAIRARHAVRTYKKDAEVTPEQIQAIQKKIDETTSPFGGEIAVKLHHFDLTKETPNTYGSVKGASWYILVGASDTPESILTLGFRMEQVALKIFEMGLGVNFITATFKGSSFITAADFPDITPLRVIMPFGVPSGKERLVEKLTHFFMKSRDRKPFDETFEGVDKNSVFREPLEMMRLAPSAYNRQPWRAVVDGNSVWFYQVPSHNSLIGVGNGLANFYLTLKYNGKEGTFSKPTDAPSREGWEFVNKFTLTE